MKTKTRCPWCEKNEVMMKYHDKEWGVPLFDDRRLFEFIVLDTFQAGLSWNAVLQKRENFRKAFAGFDPEKISKFNEEKISALLLDPGIIRNKLKVRATVTNAVAYLSVQKEYGSFEKYIWTFSDRKVIKNKWKDQSQIPAKNELSDAMSADLYSRGFKFVGSTICYAFMQAAGIVNDHITSCFRHKEV